MARLCPDCDLVLNTVSKRSVAVDSCPRCAGVFFDEGEINQMRLDGNEALSQLDDALQPSDDYFVDFQHTVEAPRNCPNCREVMDKMRYLYNSPIILDSCPKCNGVWVENGELNHMREVLEEADAAKLTARKSAQIQGPTGDVARVKRLERAMRIFNRRSNY